MGAQRLPGGQLPQPHGAAAPPHLQGRPARRGCAAPLCAGTAPAYAGSPAPLVDPEAALRSFVARLFPVAQGVFEADTGRTAFCLRYTVEVALLMAIQLAMASQDLAAAYAAQQQTADQWRAKREGRIALPALCKGLDVFQPPFVTAHRTFPCPLAINVHLPTGAYMTPGRLVRSGGHFHDPCSCGPRGGASSPPSRPPARSRSTPGGQ